MNNKNIIISGIHFKLNDNHKERVNAKCSKLFNHTDDIVSLNVELIKDIHSASHRKEYVAKGHLNLKGKVVVISSATDNMFKSIDNLVLKLDRALRRHSRLKVAKRHLHKILPKF